MKRVVILAQGRLKDPPLERLCTDYYKRCTRHLAINERELRSLKALEEALPERGPLVVLDERGTAVSSRQLASRLQGWIEDPGPQITFVIGGADGLNELIRQRASFLLSLGPLTLAHRLVRLILAEQLYRAVSILEGTPYHRG